MTDERREFVSSYVDTALEMFTHYDADWSNNNGPATRAHLDASSLASLENQAGEFFDQHSDDLAAFVPHVTSGRGRYRWSDIGGYLYWMNRNGEGVGFWDGDYPEDVGERLNVAAKKHPHVDLYVGDDGIIYV